MNGLYVWWVGLSARERFLLIVGSLTLAVWGGYTYGFTAYQKWSTEATVSYQRAADDLEWLELTREKLYTLHREGKILKKQNFESQVRQVLAQYASTSQLSFEKKDGLEIYSLRWRGENPDGFLAALQRLSQLGGSVNLVRLRNGSGKNYEAYAVIHKG